MPATNFNVPTVTPPAPWTSALDSIQVQLHEGRIAGALNDRFDHLAERREEEPEDWPTYTRACLNHPISTLLHQDPFTYRAFAKPRGYAGDAVMLDYIYGLGDAREAVRRATPLGRAIFQYLDSRPSARAVRYRRRLIAGLIDWVAERQDSRVLALAAGHVREAEISRAMQNGKVQEFVAFDQDEASLAVVDRDYARLGIRTMAGSDRQILSGDIRLEQYDLVYAAGLFDYLSEPAATALACRMVEMTRSGGLTLIPNFVMNVRDAGYAEAFMGWRLICRNHSDMLALAARLPRSSVADCRVFEDPDHAIAFLLVSKAS